MAFCQSTLILLLEILLQTTIPMTIPELRIKALHDTASDVSQFVNSYFKPQTSQFHQKKMALKLQQWILKLS